MFDKRPLSEGVLVPLEKGGYVWFRRGFIPNGATLEAELEIRRRAIEEDKRSLLRRNWGADLAQMSERLDDVLLRGVGRHIGEGRAPRSNRRVVRRASSRGDPDPPGDESDKPVALGPDPLRGLTASHLCLRRAA